ncbi:hypothetical protein [Mariniblastus fucicola]|uniref:Uncharacterized protein n=1 Tax=Mariniblastus fucicola TaxID=980251 RepID=A0A5B9P3M2_9BACT|nr:hypothetical protein [Mariniblastus fucicola]QEG20998.1 hypothetical protein MFFC18_08500 [Mariniblastus fucicola]
MEPNANIKQWIELSRQHGGKPGEARVLPIARHKSKYYFIDDRMRQLRNVEDFNDSISFKTNGELLSFKMNQCSIIT